MHTSASLTINENASPDVPLDLNDSLDRIVPEGSMYRHSDEGPDDMPAHVKVRAKEGREEGNKSAFGVAVRVHVCSNQGGIHRRAEWSRNSNWC